MSGSIRNGPGLSFSSMRVLGSYALVYLTEGGGCYQMRGRPALPCRAGDLLLVFPEIAHAYGPTPGDSWSEIYAVFEGRVFDLWRQSGLLSPDRALLRLPGKNHAATLRAILSPRGPRSPLQMLSHVCRLQEFLAAALAAGQSTTARAEENHWPHWLSTALEHMETDFRRPMESIAREVGLSYESFRKKFRACTGYSPGQYRLRRAIDLARKLIYEERLYNKELADRLGFCDEFHFSRQFHRLTGSTPRAFRRSLPAPPKSLEGPK